MKENKVLKTGSVSTPRCRGGRHYCFGSVRNSNHFCPILKDTRGIPAMLTTYFSFFAKMNTPEIASGPFFCNYHNFGHYPSSCLLFRT
jgi:hypothetical protein